MRLVYLTIGFISLGLGIIGIPLPDLTDNPLFTLIYGLLCQKFQTL